MILCIGIVAYVMFSVYVNIRILNNTCLPGIEENKIRKR